MERLDPVHHQAAAVTVMAAHQLQATIMENLLTEVSCQSQSWYLEESLVP